MKYLIIILFSTNIFSQAIDEITINTEYRAVFKKDKYGVVNILGDTIINCRYEQLKINPDNYFPIEVKSNGKWGALNKLGQFVVKSEFDTIFGFYEGRATVKKKNKFGVIDTVGKIIIPIDFDNEIELQNGFSPVKQGNKVGYVRENGKIDFLVEADWISSFDDNNLAIIKKGGKTALINKGGKICTDYFSSIVEMCGSGYYLLERNKKKGLIRSNFDIILPIEYDSIVFCDNDNTERNFILMKDAKWGMSNFNGNEILSLNYESIGYQLGKYIPVKNNNKWGVSDTSGKLVIPYKYDASKVIGKGVFSIKKGIFFGLVNENNKELTPFSLLSLSRIKDSKNNNLIVLGIKEGDIIFDENLNCVENCSLAEKMKIYFK